MSAHPHSATLRAFAGLLDQHPDFRAYQVTLTHDGTVEVHHFGSRDWDEIRGVAMSLGGIWQKVGFDDNSSLAGLRREVLPGVVVEISAMRERVCQRVVVGTETVTVPAKPAELEKTITVDKYEWQCGEAA